MSLPKLGLAHVRGRSMEPTLHEGDRLVVLYGVRPRPGRMALVRLPDDDSGAPRPLAVKRVARPAPDGAPRLVGGAGQPPRGRRLLAGRGHPHPRRPCPGAAAAAVRPARPAPPSRAAARRSRLRAPVRSEGNPNDSRVCLPLLSRSAPTATFPVVSTTRLRPASRPSRSRPSSRRRPPRTTRSSRSVRSSSRSSAPSWSSTTCGCCGPTTSRPPHFEKYPQLHTLFNEATKLAGATGTKGSSDVAKADELLAKIDQIAEIFWETKKAA